MGNAQSSAAADGDTGASTSGRQSSCPVPESVRRQAVYDVYGQRIDATPCPGQEAVDSRNQMPREPNQQPCAGQRKVISTHRELSTIPKGGTDVTWLYPSPQMFYNALKRKGKGADVVEDDVAAVVHAHNAMNEMTWRRVLDWETLHSERCGQPRLLRFCGRPDDLSSNALQSTNTALCVKWSEGDASSFWMLMCSYGLPSPLARLHSWTGGQLPFDRHDWFVDRCGEEVRYVIDFYFHEEKAGTPEAFELCVRPALDNMGSAVDRCKMAIYTSFAAAGLPCPITGKSGGHFGKQELSEAPR